TEQQRIRREILQVLQPATADYQQPDQHADHSDGPEVSTEACLTECCPDQVVETDLPQIPIKQLQSRVRSELHVAELESKITVDTSMQFGFSSSHSQWPFVCWKKTCLVTRFQPQRRTFFNSYAAATSRFCRIRVKASGSRTKDHTFAHGRRRVSAGKRMRPRVSYRCSSG